MKLRSLLPRRWREAAPAAPLAVKPSARAWSLEALEPRVLLSADPVLGAVHLALMPVDGGDADVLANAYSAAPQVQSAGPTMHALAVTAPSGSFPNPYIDTSYSLDNDSLLVSGSVSITATAGNIKIGSAGHNDFLSGNSSATVDTLTLSATGNITINAEVNTAGGSTDLLSGLTVLAAQNVSFKEAVNIKGTVEIHASGTVTFDKPVTLSEGGSLKIYGASGIYFATTSRLDLTTPNGVTPGDLLLQADTLTLLTPSSRISGTGNATIMPTTAGYGMALFSAPGVHASSLTLDNTAMGTFGAFFQSFSFGRQTGGHADANSGAVWLGGTTDANALPWDTIKVYGSTIQVDDLSDSLSWLRLDPGGALTLDATSHVTISNEVDAQTLNITSATGQIRQQDSVVDGAGRIGEALRGYTLTVQAATGVLLPNLELQTLDVVNSGQGQVTLGQNAARGNTTFLTDITGDLSVTRLEQTAVSGANGIALTTQGGSITLAAGGGNHISLAGTGALSLTALGTGSDINLLAPVSLVSGAATFSAADAFTSSAAGTISASGASAVGITAGTGALTLGAAVTTVGGTLTLSSGGALDLTGVTLDAGPGGAIALTSAGDLKVGVISAASSIALTSTGGAILDALAGNGANLVGDNAAVTLTAANGVGTGAAPLMTTIGSLTATVSGSSGGVFVSESTALSIASGGLTTAGSGAIVVRNSAADLTATGAVHANGTGHILLEAIAGNLSVQSDVLAQGGSISLVAGAALSATGTAVRAQGANQTLDLRAGTSFTQGGATLLATANAAQRLQAGTAIALAGVDAGTGAVTVIAGGAVTAVSQTATVTAASLRVQSGAGIAMGAAPLQTKVATLAASGAGNLAFNEFDGVAVGSVAEAAVNRVGGTGTATATTPAGALAGLFTSNGEIVLNAGGAVSLDSAVNATAIAGSHLRVSAGTTLAVNAAVSSTGGLVSLLAGGAITHAAAGSVTTTAQVIDEQAGGAITMAAGTAVNTAGGRLRLQAAGALTLGQLSAGNAEAWLQGTHIAGAAGTGIDLVASDARLVSTGTGASDGIGSSADVLSLQVQRLAAQSAGAGGVFIAEADAVIVDAIAATTFTRVQADGSLAALTPEAELRGIGSAAGLVLSAGGNLVAGVAMTAQRMRLSAGNDLFVGLLSGGLTSGGVLTLSAGRDLQVQDNLIATGSLDLSAGRDLLMNPGTSATAQASSAFTATRDIRVASINVGSTKALTINAGGSVTDADTAGDSSVNLSAGKLVLLANAGIGQAGNALETSAAYLGATSGGGIFIDETDALNIPGALGNNFGPVQRIAADGSVLTVTTSDVQGLNVGSSAPVVLRLLGGALTVDAAVQTQGRAIRLDASGALALNAAVASNGGAISLLAGGAVTQAAAGIVRSGGGALDAQAGGAWTQALGSSLSSGGGALRLAATGALALAQLDAGSGAMSVTASQVKDLTGDNDAQADLIAASLMLRTTGTQAADGVGTGSDLVDLVVQRLAVDTAGGGVFLAQPAGALQVDSLAAFSGSRVQLDGTLAAAAVTDAALAGLRSSASLVLLGGGSLGLNAAGSAVGSVLLTSAADLNVGAALGGLIVSLNAGNDLLLGANVNSTGSTRSLDLRAVRDITQSQGASLATVNGVIALQAGRDITIETLNAGTAGVALIAGGAIVDGDAAGDTETDITASALRLTAGGAIGTAANALETAVGTLSVSAGSLSLQQTQALAIDRVATSLQRVASDGSVGGVDLGAQEDLTTASGGALLLTVNSGDLTLNGGTASTEQTVTSGGTLLLRAVTGSIATKAGIVAAGHASLRAGGDLSFTSGGDVTLADAAGLDAEAGASINMADGSVFTSGSGSLRLAATLNLAIGALQTGGDVSLLARTISDAGGTETDVTARALRVVTTGTGTTQGFGTGAAPLQLQVGTLAASVAGTGAGGFFAREADALAITSVAVSVMRVAADGSQAAQADAALADLVSGGNVVLVSGGGLSLADGANADGVALQSAGNVLLDVGGDLSLAAALRSTSGAVSLLAAGGMNLNADVAITRTGRTLDVQAGGAVTMAATTTLSVVDSAIRVQAGGDLTVGGIAAGLGQVSLISTGGSIAAAAGHAGTEVTAASLRLNAAVGVGSSGDRLDTNVQRVSARAAGGGIWLQEADAITLTDVAVSVRRVSTLATTTATVDDATQSDLVTTGGNGSIALATTNGNILFADGTAPADGRSVTAHGTGTVSLKAGGATSVVNAPAGTIEQQGPVVIDSGLKFDGTVAITGGQGGGRGDGPITVSGAIDGTAGGAADKLVVTSNGADVVFGGAIGATERLGGLVINDARNVSFNQDVKLAGDLTLQAAGRVEFKGGLDLSAGSLSIVGATELVIGNVVIASGNAVIRVDALTLSGLISGSAAAKVELAGASGGMTVGSVTGTGLALSAAQLAAVQGFGHVQLGRSDQGTTAIAADALATLATPHLTLAGGTLALNGASTGPNAAVTLLDLAAGQDLTLAGTLALTGAGADVHATAGGALLMAANGQLATQAGDVLLQAGGDLRVGRIDTRATAGGVTAAVVLASTGGTISEANADGAADVFADLLTLRGRGPALTGGASEVPAALDVQANKLDVDAPSGVVLRDSGSDGRTGFNLLDGGQLYQQLVALGAPSRQASQAASPQQPSAASADAWAWLNALRPLAESRDTTLAASVAVPTMSALSVAAWRDAAPVFAADPAPLLPSQLAALLSLDAAAAEPLPQDAARFRVWTEELVL